jgi:general secretion pathway protein M
MKDWFDSLESRERTFVSIGAVVVVLGMLYSLVWAPLDNKHKALKADVASWQKSLTDLRPMQASANNNPNSQGSPNSGAQLSPIIVVDQTLRSRGLDRYRQRSQPTSSNGVRVEFENVAFDELVLWLGDLSAQYSMSVQAGSFSPGNQANPGRINATLTLERAL